MIFKSGFTWIKINGYSYICKILNRNTNKTFDCKVGDTIFCEVPLNELQPINGDE